MTRSRFVALPLILVWCFGLNAALADHHTPPDAPVQAETDDPPNAPEPPAEAPPATGMTPLAIGNTWAYENKDDGYISTDRVAGMVLFEGQPWYLVRTTERPIDPDAAEAESEFTSELWLAHLPGVEADGLVEMNEETGTLKLTNITRYYRTRVAVGDQYQPGDDPGHNIEVMALDETVKTKAGTFKCLVYRDTHTDEPGYSLTTYVAPGVGIVRYTTQQGDEKSSADLIQFTLIEKD